MAKTVISNLQLYKTKYFEGLNEQNNLVNALMTRPEDVTEALTLITSSHYTKYPLTALTKGMRKYKLIGNDEYDWNLMGDLEKTVQVTELVTGGSTPGIQRTTFKIKFAEKWFALGDIIWSVSGYKYQCRVQADPEQDGTEWMYTLQLIDPNPALYVPAASYAVGAEWVKVSNAFEEYSRGGHTTKVSPFKMRNQLSIFRKSDEYTGSVVTDVMVMEIKDPASGKTSRMWADMAQWNMMLQWKDEVEFGLIYGIYNRDAQGIVHLPGANGRPVLQGAGLIEQISPSNKREYSTLTEEIILEFMNDLAAEANGADNMHFVGLTGLEGLKNFHNALKASAAAYTIVDSKFIDGNGMNLSFGGQFTTYRGLNGLTFTMVHNPMYDNPKKNLAKSATTLKPLESGRITVLDFGSYGGESNVQLMAKGADGIDRSEMSWYTAGSTTPQGGSSAMGYTNTMRSSDIDGYSLHFLAHQGVMVKNPRSCGELIQTS